MSFFVFSALDSSFCIFNLFLYVTLRCTASDYSLCIFKPFVSVILRCAAPDYSFCICKLFLSVLQRFAPLITPFVSSSTSCVSFFSVPSLITPLSIEAFLYLSTFDVRPWLILLYIQTLLACHSSVYSS